MAKPNNTMDRVVYSINITDADLDAHIHLRADQVGGITEYFRRLAKTDMVQWKETAALRDAALDKLSDTERVALGLTIRGSL